MERELSLSFIYEPLVVARQRVPNKALVDKVTEGIRSAQIIIPILTKNSIITQWVNQEIGYSFYMGKKVVPIVERSIVDSLKGFIHKQNDLPFLFQSSSNKGIENKSFISSFRILIKDLTALYYVEFDKILKDASDHFGKKIKKGVNFNLSF